MENSTFIRSRRNLVLFSLALFLIESRILELNSVGVAGSGLKIVNAEHFSICCWLVLLYFVWRYYTCFKDLEVDTLGKRYDSNLLSILGSIAFKSNLFERGTKEKVILDDGVYEENTYTATELKHDDYAYVVEIYIENNTYHTDNSKRAHMPFKATRRFLRKDCKKYEIKAYLLSILDSAYFSEYYFPFFILFLPIGTRHYGIYQVLTGV